MLNTDLPSLTKMFLLKPVFHFAGRNVWFTLLEFTNITKSAINLEQLTLQKSGMGF